MSFWCKILNKNLLHGSYRKVQCCASCKICTSLGGNNGTGGRPVLVLVIYGDTCLIRRVSLEEIRAVNQGHKFLLSQHMYMSKLKLCCAHLGKISESIQSLRRWLESARPNENIPNSERQPLIAITWNNIFIIMSFFPALFLGNFEVSKVNDWNMFWKYMSVRVYECLYLDHLWNRACLILFAFDPYPKYLTTW